jgi:hypothetical protein
MKRLLCMALASLALNAGATELELAIPRDKAEPQNACESSVVRRCPPTPEAQSRPRSYRELEQRRTSPDIDRILETVVIEGERQRRKPTLKELLESGAPPPPGVSYEHTRRADGSLCTCSTPCLSAPIVPCCVCSKGGSNQRINGTVN